MCKELLGGWRWQALDTCLTGVDRLVSACIGKGYFGGNVDQVGPKLQDTLLSVG